MAIRSKRLLRYGTICLAVAGVVACQPVPPVDQEPPPAPTSVAPVTPPPAKKVVDTSEPRPMAAPRTSVEVKSIPLPTDSKTGYKRAPAMTSAPEASVLPGVQVARPLERRTVDLETLRARLQATDALGPLTKQVIKADIDELVDRFRAYHKGDRSIQLAVLRERLGLLLMKVTALIQERDPPLFLELRDAREDLWARLADPKQFADLRG